MRISPSFATLLALSYATIAIANDADEISTAEIRQNTFEITIRSKTISDVQGATRRIMPTILKLCGDLYPDLGHYRFDKSESLSNKDADVLFSMVQNVECVESRPPKPSKSPRPQLESEQAVRAVRHRVKALSTQYFENRYANLGPDANSALSANSAKQDAPSPNEELAKSPPTEINLYRITVYDNPENAPSAGIYVAVDYDNQVGNVAHHCGYLMWHSPDAFEFSLGRIESGTLSDKLLQSMAPEDVAPTRKALRCSNFYDK